MCERTRLVPIGSLPPRALEWIEIAAAGVAPIAHASIASDSHSRSGLRCQARPVPVGRIMKTLAQCAPRDAFRVLGITDVDLSIHAELCNSNHRQSRSHSGTFFAASLHFLAMGPDSVGSLSIKYSV